MVQKKSTVQNGDAISKLISTKSEYFFEKFPKIHDANPGRHHDSGASAVPLCSTRGPKKRPQGSGVASK